LLTDELPHARDSTTLESLIERVRTETIEKPSVRLRRHTAHAAVRAGETRSRLARAIAGDLDTIVLTALRREPERRYANAAALAEDLRRWVAGRPVAAQPDTAGYRARKFVARNRLAVASAGAVLLALITGFGTALWQAGQARAEAERARLQSELAQKAQNEAERINQFFGDMLSDAQPLDQDRGVSLTVSQWIAAAVPRLDTELADAPGARATLRRELGSALNSLGDAGAAQRLLITAVRENREIYGESLQTAGAMQMLALSSFAHGDHALARRTGEEAIEMLDRLPADNDTRNLRIQIRTTLLRVYSLTGDQHGALTMAERNLADRAVLYGADDPRFAVDYNNLSGTLNRLSRLAEAEAEAAMQKTLELLARNPARPVGRIAFVQQGLCTLATQRANYSDALSSCARAAELYAEALGADSIELASLAVTEARVHFMAGESARAVALLDGAEANLTDAGRGVDLREAWLLRARLAIRERDWVGLETHTARLLEALPGPPAGVVSGERTVAEAFAALGRAMRTRDAADGAEARNAAETLLARDDVVALFRASAALAAAIVADAMGDKASVDSLRQRGIAALALNMPRSEAAALWERWWPIATR
jgi:serine/threonine-protein kinase